MPIYEYTCESCGKRFDYLARTLADRPEKCPDCGAETLKKAFSTFAAKSDSPAMPCANAASCGHAHGPGCGCCCHG
ncbi:MAG: zinc ribbon domain-containing protein [Kiritimatiellae bacterium]|nr:zinc ribbon domain-containing protein [Kiritimatiellia bacterium]